MRKTAPGRVCFALLVACIPASMLLVVWLPSSAVEVLRGHWPGLLSLLASITPLFPTWSQYFAVQTLAAGVAVCLASCRLWRRAGSAPAPQPRPLLIFLALVAAYAAWAALSCLWSEWPYGTARYVLRELPFYFLCIAAALVCGARARWLVVAKVFAGAALLQAALQGWAMLDALGRSAELKAALADAGPMPLAVIAGPVGLGMSLAAGVLAGRWRALGRRAAALLVLGGGVAGLAGVTLAVAALFATYGDLAQTAFGNNPVFYGNPNFGSAILLTAAFVAVGGLIGRGARVAQAARPDGPALWPVRSVLTVSGWTAVLAVLGFTLLAAGSLAGAVAAAVAGTAYVFCIVPLKKKHWLAAGLIACGMAAVVGVLQSDSLRRRLLGAALSPRSTMHLRVVDWVAAGRMFARRPLLGRGMGTWAAAYPRFKPALASRLAFTRNVRPTHPHNEFIRVATDLGTVGLALYVAAIALALTVSYGQLRRMGREERLNGYALWAGMVAFAVQSCFGKAPMQWSFAVNFWLLLGVLGSAPALGLENGAEVAPEAHRVRRRRTPRAVALAAVATASVAALVGWGWLTWAVGGYASMMHLQAASNERKRMGDPNRAVAWRHFEAFRRHLEAARPACLWPDEVLYGDYVVGWFLKNQGEWGAAADALERVQDTAPEYMKTRLFLAECLLGMGSWQRALAEVAEFVRRNPYNMDGYRLMARISPQTALRSLEAHVLPRLARRPEEAFPDYPTAAEVRTLLRFYALAGAWERAGQFVRTARKLYAEPDVRPRVAVDRQVRLVAGELREAGHPELSEALERHFLDAFRKQRK